MGALTHCRVCGSANVEQFFDLGSQPLANALVREANVADPTYPLSLSFCKDCSLVQLDHTADPGELFSHYVWVTSTSSTARAYAEQFCDRLLARVGGESGGYVLEIASNDGTFLKPFLKRGVDCLGVDPAANIVEMAVADGVPSRCGFFGEALAKDVVAERGNPKAVFARNVLPHVAGTNDFVEGLKVAAGADGMVVIEFHYAKTILEELHYDSIYHEHLCYFTLKSLTHLLNAHGIHPFDLEQSPISGGSLVLFARTKPTEKSERLRAFETAEKASGANDLAAWKRFAEVSFEHRAALLALLEAEAAAGRKVAGYGASARSSTMLNFCGVGPRLIQAIADQNPMKHDLFSPSTHIPILAPEAVMAQKPDTVVILAWNFFAEIVGILRERFGFTGRVIMPLPHPPRAMSMEEAKNV
jgi:hypothetical protein